MTSISELLDGRDSAEWVEKDLRYLVHPSAPTTGERLIVTSGHGCTLVGEDGREYLDMHAGAWLVQAGHGRQEIADAVRDQLSDFAHFSLMLGVTNKPAIALAERLISFAPSGFGRVRFSTSGSEADDEAFQLVRYYHAVSGAPSRTKVLTLRGAFHGRTAAGNGLARHEPPGVRPLFDDVVVQVAAPVPYRSECPDGEQLVDFCIRDLERTIEAVGAENIAAMFGEPAQGPGGMVPLPAEYWLRAQEILHANGILLVMDEVVTGMGRSGEWLVSTSIGLQPDLIVVAKGLASGYMPISALLLSDEVARTVETLGGSGSYGGHAASCAAALVNLEIIEREDLLANARERGAQFLRELQELRDLEIVGDVHGIGLMIGVSLVVDKATKEPLENLDEALTLDIRREYGVILQVSRGSIILTPPLVVTEAEVTRTVQAIRAALERIGPDRTLSPVHG